MDADVEQALQLAKRCEDASTHAYVLTLAGAALIHGRSIDAGYRLFQQGLDVCETNDLTFHLPAAHANSGFGWRGPGGSTGHADMLDAPSS